MGTTKRERMLKGNPLNEIDWKVEKKKGEKWNQ